MAITVSANRVMAARLHAETPDKPGVTGGAKKYPVTHPAYSLQKTMAPSPHPNPVILYDGSCGLCKGSVRFLKQIDRNRKLNCISTQSAEGKQLLGPFSTRFRTLPDAVFLLEDCTLYSESTAVLKAIRYLPYPWKIFYGLITVPEYLRDGIYRFIARHRSTWPCPVTSTPEDGLVPPLVTPACPESWQ